MTPSNRNVGGVSENVVGGRVATVGGSRMSGTGEFDLVVRGGLVVDGSGAPGVRGDVAIVGDRIVAVGEVDGRGARRSTPTGWWWLPDSSTRTPTWTPRSSGTTSVRRRAGTASPRSSWATAASPWRPRRPDARALVVRNLERAEDIAAEAMAEGIDWSWSTFPEYLDAVDAQPKGLNYAAAIGHSALRTWAMGERAFEETGHRGRLAVMAAELRAALDAGAAGFTTSRTIAHVTSDDRPVASRLAVVGRGLPARQHRRPRERRRIPARARA